MYKRQSFIFPEKLWNGRFFSQGSNCTRTGRRPHTAFMKRIYHVPGTLAGLSCAILAAVAMLSLFSCGENGQAGNKNRHHMDNKYLKTIYLAGGCFWGVEKYFSLIHGVKETEVGYALSLIHILRDYVELPGPVPGWGGHRLPHPRPQAPRSGVRA